MAKGNDSINSLLIALTAYIFYQLTHINTRGLMNKFQSSRQEAQNIVSACPTCTLTHQVPTTTGVNPRGLYPNDIWQTDVTHSLLLDFRELFLFLWILIRKWFVLLLILEKHLLMLSHIFCKLFLMGLLKHIKTDNGLAYMSYCFGNV